MDAMFQWHRYISECFHQGILPLWCPYSRLGYPFFGDPQSGLYYPVTLLFALLYKYNVFTANAEFSIHLIIASTGMYKLLKVLKYDELPAVTFGIVYALSGIFVSNAMHYTLFVSAAWTPWFFLAQLNIERKGDTASLMQAILLTALMICGGYIALAIINCYIALFYHLLRLLKSNTRAIYFKRLTLYNLGVLLLTFTYFAVFIINMEYIDRGNGVSLVGANFNAFTLKSFISFVFPLFTTNLNLNFGNDISMRNIYFGFLLLPFTGYYLIKYSSPFEKVISFIGILFLLISLGDLIPLRTWLYNFVPLMNTFRFASIFRFIAELCFIILACGTFEWITNNWKQQLSIVKRGYIVYAILLIIMITSAIIFNPQIIFAPIFSADKWDNFYQSNIWNLIFNQSAIHLSLLLILIGFAFFNKLKPSVFAMLIIADVLSASLLNQFSTVCLNKKTTELQIAINQYPAGFPIPGNEIIGSQSETGTDDIASPIWHNAGFIKKQITFNGNNSFNLKTYNNIADKNIFEATAYPFATMRDSASLFQCTSFSPNKFTFSLINNRADTLKLMQMNYPFWNIKVDGKRADKINSELLQVKVDSGKHIVSFSFENKWIKWLLYLNLFLWSSFIIATISSSIKRF